MRSHFLFAIPSLLSGIARSLDLAGEFDQYNDSASVEEADARAMYSDFRMVGEDLWSAIHKFHDSIDSTHMKETQ